MDVSQISVMEHLAVECELPLREFCEVLQRRLNLPPFEFDFENETEWGLVVWKGIEYNVSRPFERGTLQEWDDTVPAACNFGVSLSVSNECPLWREAGWTSSGLAHRVGKEIAATLGRSVVHHRTWFGPGTNVTRYLVLEPESETQ